MTEERNIDSIPKEQEESVSEMAISLARLALEAAKAYTSASALDPTTIANLLQLGPLLWITELDPSAPFVNQPMTIKFTLMNLSRLPTSGYVHADFGENVAVTDLPPGQVTTGSFIYTPTRVGHNQSVTLVYYANTGTHPDQRPKGRVSKILDEQLPQDTAVFDVRTDYILEVNDAYQNPAGPSDDGWNAAVCNNHTAFDAGHWLDDNNLEWAPVLPPHDERGGDMAVSGVVCEQHLSGVDPDDFHRDMPFVHPFHNDWEMYIAPDELYLSLLAPTQSQNPDDGYSAGTRYAEDNGIQIPSGLLGVEIQRGFVPVDYRAGEGDRVAMLGRWIVDCGHNNYTTEIHEPLLLAVGRSQRYTTTVQVIGRPFFVSQMFEMHSLTHAMTVGFGDRLAEGHLELLFPPLLALLRPIELRPNVLSPPFVGTRSLPLTIRPPQPRPSPSSRLYASYHFTVRSGVSVSVSSTGHEDEALLTISMDSSQYQPAQPPAPYNVNVPWDGPQGLLAGMLPDDAKGVQAFFGIAGALDPVVGMVWGKGFDTDRYDLPPPGSPRDGENVVMNARVTGDGIVGAASSGYAVDDSQPYPIYGWFTLHWSDYSHSVFRNPILVAAERLRAAGTPQDVLMRRDPRPGR